MCVAAKILPTGEPLSDEEELGETTRVIELYWQSVVADFPDAERPVVDIAEVVDAGDREAPLADCLKNQGVSVPADQSAESWYPATEGEALAWFTCQASYPPRPSPPITDDQLGYLYDYLTLFVAPCLNKHGSNVPKPPSREDFITEWPNQMWYPEPTNVHGDDPEYAGILEACPLRPDAP